MAAADYLEFSYHISDPANTANTLTIIEATLKHRVADTELYGKSYGYQTDHV